MKLSTRTRYGVRAMVELALNNSKLPLPAKIIAQRQDISIKYLEQLMTTLKSQGLIRSLRGAKGGYLLARAANQIKISEIFNCLEGPALPVECLESETVCERAADCITRQVWMQVRDAIDNILESITLQDLVDKTENNKKADYQI